MKDVLTYKNFIGSLHYSSEDNVFYGKVEGIDDLVTFEGKSVKELNNAFKESIQDYLILCKETGKKPLKTFKGSFNVRITLKLHRLAFQKALKRGMSLNKFVNKAIEHEVLNKD